MKDLLTEADHNMHMIVTEHLPITWSKLMTKQHQQLFLTGVSESGTEFNIAINNYNLVHNSMRLGYLL